MTNSSKATKAKELFTLGKHYGDKVDGVGIFIKDIQVGSDSRGAIVFVTLKLNDATIEAQMPLADSPSFKRHILSLIDQTLKLKRSKEAVSKFK
jgi:hypothetical protein